MRRPHGSTWLVSCLLFAVFHGGLACGGDSEGRGSGTLRVEASLEARNRVPDASTTSDFDTEMSVEVRKDGGAVSGATVIIETDVGVVELTGGNSGEYHGSQNGYGRVFLLSVEAEDDFVRGVRLNGPDIHVFDAPSQGGDHPADTDMVVRWTPGGADRAVISVAELDRATISDTGEYTVLGRHLLADEGDVEEEEIELWRTNSLTPDGTTTGSTVSVSVRNTLDISVVGP